MRDDDIPSRGPGSLVHHGDGGTSGCLKCGWRGPPRIDPTTHGVDHRCPRCEISPETDALAAELAERAALPKVGRNDPCSCGSGVKFKKCCGR